MTNFMIRLAETEQKRDISLPGATEKQDMSLTSIPYIVNKGAKILRFKKGKIMTRQDNVAAIDPVRLGIKSKFKFRCHKGVACFTKCCREIRITLTPYDIIRLKKRLALTSEEFLAIYTEPHLLEKTDLPVVTLKLMDDELQSCPFVRPAGCILYEDRPTT